ncbi:hypothetical protein D3C71_1872190 [compost metagenome]
MLQAFQKRKGFLHRFLDQAEMLHFLADNRALHSQGFLQILLMPVTLDDASDLINGHADILQRHNPLQTGQILLGVVPVPRAGPVAGI